MRILKYVAKKSLLAFGYPKLETTHPDRGVYDVGAVKTRMAPDVPACQFFYPVDKNRKKADDNNEETEFVPYYRKEAVEGLVEYLNGFGDGILQMLEETAHPLGDGYGAEPLTKKSTQTTSSSDDNKFPLVLFSHGLSGTMEMYTELCAQIASTGCVVVAVEHEDGSASYASTSDGIRIPYKQPLPNAKVPYSRKKVLDFRTPMLEQRVNEQRRIIECLLRTNEESDSNSDDETPLSTLVRKIISVTDISRLHLVGHSFGGATQLLAGQTWAKQEPSMAVAMTTSATAVASAATTQKISEPRDTVVLPPPSPHPIPRSITVFDAWNFALSDKVLQEGLSTETVGIDVLSVLSEGWTTNSERAQTLEFLKRCDPNSTRSMYARDSVHQSVSDTEAYLPSWAATRVANRGTNEPRHRTIRALVEEIAKFTNGEKIDQKDCENENDETESVLVPFPFR